MKAFAGLFTEPGVECKYDGYERVAVDYVDQYFLKPVGITFPGCLSGPVGGINHIAIIDEKGEVLCATALSNALSGKEGEPFRVILFCNLPVDLNPIARKAYEMVLMGEMKAEDLHPKLYEAINDVLHDAGIPVIPCRRQAAANWEGKLSMMPSLKDMGIAGEA